MMKILAILMMIGTFAVISFAQTSTKLETNKASANFTLKASETKLWNVDVKKKQPICFEVNADSKDVIFTFNAQVVTLNKSDVTCFTPGTTTDGNYEIKLVNNGTTSAKGGFAYRKELQY